MRGVVRVSMLSQGECPVCSEREVFISTLVCLPPSGGKPQSVTVEVVAAVVGAVGSGGGSGVVLLESILSGPVRKPLVSAVASLHNWSTSRLTVA